MSTLLFTLPLSLYKDIAKLGKVEYYQLFAVLFSFFSNIITCDL